jgi:hypothetical protein
MHIFRRRTDISWAMHLGGITEHFGRLTQLWLASDHQGGRRAVGAAWDAISVE